uniref:dihydroxyacetone phosphate acyltransferase n=1 Tax=Myxine glutinosa TaxID=7769 RepID=UPI00358F3690
MVSLGYPGERFEDVLEERRCSSDLLFSARRFAPPTYRHRCPRSPAALRQAVLDSPRLQQAIREMAGEDGDTEALRQEAQSILREMGHNQGMTVVRTFAFMLSRIFKALFRHVRVNEEGVQRVQKVVRECPIVLLPSHRSYVDFLLMSFLCYSYDLPLPVIAAGMDFQGMRLVGEMLQASGAFYMRRSFSNNPFYWAVFSEYVQAIVRNGDAPLEFFLEGTRSRSNKSLSPKLGLLSIVMEPLLRAQVFDALLVPVSISYERILEENLYARELVGVPKPKESTSGLLKAHRILQNDYGSVFVYFHPPMSLKSFISGRLDITPFSMTPRHMALRLSDTLRVLVHHLAHSVVLRQQQGMVVTPWSLLTTLLLQAPSDHLFPASCNSEGGVHLPDLLHDVRCLRTVITRIGAMQDWPDARSDEDVVLSSLAMNSSLVTLTKEGRVRLNVDEVDRPKCRDGILNRACAVLTCAAYRNHILHLFVRPAFVAMAQRHAGSVEDGPTFSHFCFLVQLFSEEFIFEPESERKDYEVGLALLQRCSSLLYPLDSQHHLSIVTTNFAVFLNRIFQPFCCSYQMVCDYFLTLKHDSMQKEGQLLSSLQEFALQQLLEGRSAELEILNINVHRNALASLSRLGALRRERRKDGVWFLPTSQLHHVADAVASLKPPSQLPAKL